MSTAPAYDRPGDEVSAVRTRRWSIPWVRERREAEPEGPQWHAHTVRPWSDPSIQTRLGRLSFEHLQRLADCQTMIESTDWSGVEGDVCPACVPDEGLSAWIALEGSPGSACAVFGESAFTTAIEDLFNYMVSVIERDWSPASVSDQIPFSHEYRDDPNLRPVELSTSELLWELDEPLGSEATPSITAQPGLRRTIAGSERVNDQASACRYEPNKEIPVPAYPRCEHR